MKCLRALPLLLLVAACSGGGSSSGGEDQAEDPVVEDYPVAFVLRQLSSDDDGSLLQDNIYEPAEFFAGAQLILKDRATASAAETVITANIFDGDYDVKDLNTSADGSQLIFAMRAPEIEDADDDEQPTWNIWVYNTETEELNRVIESDLTAEEGQDIAPAFLPDGRIIFSSTRQRRSRALLLDDDKPQFSALTENREEPAFVLHVMEADGTDITQISFNQSHDLNPVVLSDGRILFNRWDNAAGIDKLSLYTVKPDGSDLAVYYGYHSQNTGTEETEAAFNRPHEMPDGRLLVTLRALSGLTYGGDLVTIDGIVYSEAYSEPEQSGEMVGQASITVGEVTTDDTISPHGTFASAWPFYDGTSRLLVTWSECRVINEETELLETCPDTLAEDEEVQLADPLYGLWIYNYIAGTQLPIVVVEEGEMISEGVTLEPRTEPTYIPDPVPGVDVDADLVEESVGILDIRSVYDFDGEDIAGIETLADPAQTTADLRPARFLKISKAVGIPDDDVLDFDGAAFGRNGNQGMREILGYTPIQPDGSVRVKVPADMPLAISVVDADGKRIFDSHNNWLQLQAGEVRSCNGCHTSDSEAPHGRTDMQLDSAWDGAPTSAAPFANTEPALLAEMGETMAQLLARYIGEAELEGDLHFTDLWTDPAVRTKDDELLLSYGDLSTDAPVESTCLTEWESNCRIVIHYEQHIQPLWDFPREVLDSTGAVIADYTCTGCHSPVDAAGATQIPDGQLDLTTSASSVNDAWFVSYSELVADRAELELSSGVLTPRLVQEFDDDGNPVYEVDEDGELVLDNNGDPIPVMVTVNISSPLTSSALESSFFSIFENGGAHQGYLEDAELRLIAEWFDIGAQYYNDPFAAPAD
ncbi:HzsA-related protein [Microbulbifer sp. ZKSA002]|uniref:HzsA-related protein n=1 Tax=Microbulbifer sp. ZKSA002 TaxID=3243388 RepID=UPI00403A03E4